MTDPLSTPPPTYGRCGECDEIKHVSPDGVLHDHNRYRARSTAVVALRCAGSGTRPVDLGPDSLNT